MNYNLGEKYQYTNSRKVSASLKTLFIAIKVAIIFSIIFVLSLIIGNFVTSYNFVNVLLITLAVLVTFSIYRNGPVRESISSLIIYKVGSIVLLFFFVIPVSLGVVSLITSNVKKGLNFRAYSLSGANDDMFLVFKSYTINLSSKHVTLPTTFTVILSLIIIGLIVFIIIRANYQGFLYIESDKELSSPRLENSFYSEDLNINSIDYETLSTLKRSSDDLIYANRYYFDIYVYGNYTEKYFYIESYITNEKGKKIEMLNMESSPIFYYDKNKFIFENRVINDEEPISLNNHTLQEEIVELTQKEVNENTLEEPSSLNNQEIVELTQKEVSENVLDEPVILSDTFIDNTEK